MEPLQRLGQIDIMSMLASTMPPSTDKAQLYAALGGAFPQLSWAAAPTRVQETGEVAIAQAPGPGPIRPQARLPTAQLLMELTQRAASPSEGAKNCTAETLHHDNSAAASTAAASALAALGAARGHAHGVDAPGMQALPSSGGSRSPSASAGPGSHPHPVSQVGSYRPRKQALRRGPSQEPGADDMLDDDVDVKRAKRMLSNRESARRSRMRKQAECEDLARVVAQLKAENDALRDQNQQLRVENQMLKSQGGSDMTQQESPHADQDVEFRNRKC